MSDPRLDPGWKHKRFDDRSQMVWLAILDELIALNQKLAAQPVTQARRKKDANEAV